MNITKHPIRNTSIILVSGLIIYAISQNIALKQPPIGALLGTNIAEFKLQTLAGKSLQTSDIVAEKKKFILLNFFASWCHTCLIEHPLLNQLAGQKNLLIYGVLVKDHIKNAQPWLEEHGNPYDIVAIDKSYHLKKQFKLFGVPESFLIKNGIIIAHFRGPINPEQIKQIINNNLNA
jgi:cytochrome c biogenesis protein CcmG/thiol:disulfide interchange protein DsbE